MKITGAGILLLELYKNNPVITLFGNNNKKFEELGGSIDKKETPVEAAYREGREESCNLVYIRPEELTKYGTPVKNKEYVDYIMYIENLSHKDYHANMRKVHKKCKGHSWKETSEMARFHLNDIINAAQRKKNTVKDINGIKRDIRGRTTDIIRKSVDLLYHMYMNNYPALMTRQKVKKSRKKCLVGTITYTLAGRELTYYQKPKGKKQRLQPIIVDIIPQTGVEMITPGSPGSPYSPYSQFSPSLYQYAVYAAPNLNMYSDPFLLNCNLAWADQSKPGTGMHVTITGFDENQPQIKKHLSNISKSGKSPWAINLRTASINRNMINFQSNTLNTIADYLSAHGFKRIKGPRYANVSWHMTSECAIPNNLLNVLSNLTWSLVIVSRDNNGVIRWHERYPLNTN